MPEIHVSEDSRCSMCFDYKKKQWLIALISDEDDVKICEAWLRHSLAMIKQERERIYSEIENSQRIRQLEKGVRSEF